MQRGLTLSARNHEVDFLRGIAILAVVLLHAALLTKGIEHYTYFIIFVRRLSTGIQLFFVLSGFLISASWERCLASGEGAKGFFLRRAAKIAPLYLIFLHFHLGLFWLALKYAPEVAPLRNSATVDNVTWLGYLVHLGFLQGIFPAYLHTQLDGSWSIVNEVYFYLLFGLALHRICDDAVKASQLYACSLLIAILFILLIGRHVSALSHYGFLAQLPCFVLGVLAHRLSQTPGFDRIFSPWRRTALAICALVMLGLVKGGDNKPLGDFNIYAICFSVVLLCGSTLTELLPRALTSSVAVAGRMSYALFFVHLALLKITYVVLAKRQIELDLLSALALNIFIALPLSWSVAAYIFDPIDRYFVALGGRWQAIKSTHPPNRSGL